MTIVEPPNPKCPIFAGTLAWWVIFIFCVFQTLQESKNPPGCKSVGNFLKRSFYHLVKVNTQSFLASSQQARWGPDGKDKASVLHSGGWWVGKGAECYPCSDLRINRPTHPVVLTWRHIRTPWSVPCPHSHPPPRTAALVGAENKSKMNEGLCSCLTTDLT